jgi:hypothetical protein
LLCFRCGEDNPPGYNFCNRCNAKLPKFSTNVSPAIIAPKTERLMKILDLANKALDGQLPPQTIINEIEKQETTFRNIEKKFRNTPLHKSLKQEFQPQIDTGLSGMDLFLKSLGAIKDVIIEAAPPEEYPDETDEKLYFELSEENQALIMDAIETAKEGNEYLNRCFEMSEESMRKVREESIMYEDDSSIL